ncbi:hypothetical protein [Hyphomonas sp.]|uniref:hypothetical protein n=1 Tax=Hyphomonas sp. TaxID=87 RepID=UPI003F6E6B89
MNVLDVVEITLRASERTSDRKLSLRLFMLADKLHDLFIPPDRAAKILGSMADGSIKSQELERIQYRIEANAREIDRLTGDLTSLAATNGRELFSPSELHLLETLVDRKLGVRVAIIDIFRRYRNVKAAKKYPYVEQTAAEWRRWGVADASPDAIERMKSDESVIQDAKNLLTQIETLNSLLDRMFVSLTDTAPKVASGAIKKRSGRGGRVLLAVFVGLVFWVVGATTSHLVEPYIDQIADEARFFLASAFR